MTPPLLELRGITRRFGATVALEDVHFVLHAGTVHALLGENGAGKTTLMRIAFGLLAPDDGEIRRDGARITLRTPGDAIGRGIGMVHQHFTLVPAMTAAENVALGGRGRYDAERIERTLAALSRESGLPLDPRARVADMPIAAQQRVEILKALHRRARILILDEPTAVLAPAEADELLRWLRSYAAAGNAVVLITHRLREAVAVADAVTVLRHGRVVVHEPAGPFDVARLTTAMVGSGAPSPAARRPAHAVDAGAPAVVQAVRAGAQVRRERIGGIDLVVRRGEIVGVAGVEGSGHHVLLRLLAGRLPPDEGQLVLPPRIGFVPEDRMRHAVLPDESLAATVALKGAGRRSGRMHWRAWRERATEMVARHDVRGTTGVPEPARLPVSALSGGNQQKLVVARELADDPQLIVAENPTRGLDVRAAAAVMAQLRDAARGGAAVVIHSADLDEVLAVADRMLVVHAGTVHETPPERDLVGRAMLGVS